MFYQISKYTVNWPIVRIYFCPRTLTVELFWTTAYKCIPGDVPVLMCSKAGNDTNIATILADSVDTFMYHMIF